MPTEFVSSKTVVQLVVRDEEPVTFPYGGSTIQPTEVGIAFYHDGRIRADVGGFVVRADGTPGKRTNTIMFNGTRHHMKDWPVWLKEYVLSSAHSLRHHDSTHGSDDER